MLKVTVDRARWLNGDYSRATGANSKLLDKNGMMCCLGFACLAAGIAENKILGRFYPHSLIRYDGNREPPFNNRDELPSTIRPLIGVGVMGSVGQSLVCKKLTHANDAIADYEGKPPKAREADIIEFGREAGIEFTFVGEYPVGTG